MKQYKEFLSLLQASLLGATVYFYEKRTPETESNPEHTVKQLRCYGERIIMESYHITVNRWKIHGASESSALLQAFGKGFGSELYSC